MEGMWLTGWVSLVALGLNGQTIAIYSWHDPYGQDFNTLASSGTSSILPLGWHFSESGTSGNKTYSAGTGSSNAGDTYSFGAAGSPERALGSLRSGSVVPVIGAVFVNNTGETLDALMISYVGEQWRLGALGRPDKLSVQYSQDAFSLVTGTWTAAAALGFTAPVSAGVVGALDGNTAPNRTSIAATVTGLSLVNGGTLWLRWVVLTP